VLRFAALFVPVLVACTSDPVSEICPPIGAGDLVVTELRGNQGGTSGEWIEVVNVSSRSLDLYGLQLRIRGLDGDGLETAIVRRALVVPAGGRAVIGAFSDDQRPSHVGYGWHPDLIGSGGAVQHLPDSGAIDLVTCDVVIDRVVWNDLPSAGTRSLGLDPPDANGNDNPAAWCVNTAGPDGAGSPGESNPACP
jgi:hypothetical protein